MNSKHSPSAEYVDPTGARRRDPLDALTDLALEAFEPVRVIPHYRGQTNTPGYYWSTTNQRHVAYESMLERQWMQILDFDQSVGAFASQPIKLSHPAYGATPWQHVPDLFVRRADGSGRFIDVRFEGLLDEKMLAKFEHTHELLAETPFDYVVLCTPTRVWMENIDWLSAYRRELSDPAQIADILASVTGPISIADLCEQQPRSTKRLPAILHLIWAHQLQVALEERLRPNSIVSPGTAAGQLSDTTLIARGHTVTAARTALALPTAAAARVGLTVPAASRRSSRLVVPVTAPGSRSRVFNTKDLDTLTADRISQVEAKVKGIIATQDGRSRGEGPTRSDVIAESAAELGISTRTMKRKVASYREHGVAGLLDTRLATPRQRRQLDERVVAAVLNQHRVEAYESNAPQGRWLRRLRNRLDETYGAGVVPLPSDRTLNRWIDEILRGQSRAAPAARRRSRADVPRKSWTKLTASRVGQQVMFDTTRLGVLAFDPESASAYPVDLVIAIDVATRLLVSWRLTPQGANRADASLLLGDALQPERMRPGWDERLSYRYLEVAEPRELALDDRLRDAAAKPIIVPEEIVVDHDKIYLSDAARVACAKLGISLQPARKVQPTDKAIVEREFGTIANGFSAHIAGATGESPARRGLDVEGSARWTLIELEELFAEWVIGWYHNRPHRALHWAGERDLISPNEAYRRAIAAYGQVDPPDVPDLYFQLLPIFWRRIRTLGVEIDYRVYDSDAAFRDRRGTRSPYKGGLWPIRLDPRNVLAAFFQDPDTLRWHELKWRGIDDRTKPMSERTLTIARRRAREATNGTWTSDELAQFSTDFQNRADAPETWRATSRKRLIADRARAQRAAADRAKAREQPVAGQPSREPASSDWVLDLDAIPAMPIWYPGFAADGNRGGDPSRSEGANFQTDSGDAAHSAVREE